MCTVHVDRAMQNSNAILVYGIITKAKSASRISLQTLYLKTSIYIRTTTHTQRKKKTKGKPTFHPSIHPFIYSLHKKNQRNLMPIRIIPLPTTIVVSSSSSSSSSSTRKTTTMTKRCSSWTTIFFSTVTMLMFLLLLFIVQVSGHSGQNQPMIIPTNGWIAIEVVTEGDLFQSSTSSNLWEMPKYMDGIGAFLVPPNNNTTPNNEILRINVNHEDEDEASVSEINIDVYKLKQTISNHVSMTTDHDGGSSASSISVMSKRSSSSADDENGEDYFIQSVRCKLQHKNECTLLFFFQHTLISFFNNYILKIYYSFILFYFVRACK